MSPTGNSVKLSYAQMVQKAKAAEVSANSLNDRSDESETEECNEKPSASTSNRALKEQGQHPANSSSKQSSRGPARGDLGRKDSANCDSESRRDNDYRKENDYRREDPREQRNRKLKENRERINRRGNPRDRDSVPVKEREGPRAAVAK